MRKLTITGLWFVCHTKAWHATFNLLASLADGSQGGNSRETAMPGCAVRPAKGRGVLSFAALRVAVLGLGFGLGFDATQSTWPFSILMFIYLRVFSRHRQSHSWGSQDWDTKVRDTWGAHAVAVATLPTGEIVTGSQDSAGWRFEVAGV